MARILVIDDEFHLRDILREMLEMAGHEVFDAPDGDIGIKMFKEKLPDLVITDIIMPIKDGLEVITEIRRTDSRVNIIAISGGHNNFDNLNTAKTLGADRTFNKPFDWNELLKAVEELLGSCCSFKESKRNTGKSFLDLKTI